MELPKVSVVIPCHNVEKEIANCITALLEQDYPKDKFEIIVVDDGSTDDTLGIVSGYDIKVLRHERRKGRAVAMNTGIEVASGSIIAFTNADCVPEKSWLMKLIAGYTNDRVAGVGGLTTTPAEGDIYLEFMRRLSYMQYNGPENTYSPLSSSNISYRKSILQEVGGFDTDLQFSGEDQDIWLKVKQLGYDVLYTQKAKVYHYHHAFKLGSYAKWWQVRGENFPLWLKKRTPSIQVAYSRYLLGASIPTYATFILPLVFLGFATGNHVFYLLSSIILALLTSYLILSTMKSLVTPRRDKIEGQTYNLITVNIWRFDFANAGLVKIVKLIFIGLVASFAFTFGKFVGSYKYRYLVL